MKDISISLISISLAVAGYAIWYRLAVAPWCPAMWSGTAPPILIGVFFLTFRKILMQLGGGRDGEK